MVARRESVFFAGKIAAMLFDGQVFARCGMVDQRVHIADKRARCLRFSRFFSRSRLWNLDGACGSWRVVWRGAICFYTHLLRLAGGNGLSKGFPDGCGRQGAL